MIGGDFLSGRIHVVGAPFAQDGLDQQQACPILLLTAAVQILFIASYQKWGDGTADASRYLHPAILPLAVGAVEFRRRCAGRFMRAVLAALLAYSILLNVYAGLLPFAAYDQSPSGMARRLLSHVSSRR
jgi:hypothetical protein